MAPGASELPAVLPSAPATPTRRIDDAVAREQRQRRERKEPRPAQPDPDDPHQVDEYV